MRKKLLKKTKNITKLIKAELKIAFPETDFYITSRNLGSTILIYYINNFIKYSEVSKCVEKFRAGDFDEKIDSYVYKKDKVKYPRAEYIIIFNYIDVCSLYFIILREKNKKEGAL